MEFKKGLKGFVAASVMTLTTVTAAHASVKCPSASAVKGTVKALNTVMRQGQQGFMVFTAQPAVNASNLGWLVLAQERANGFDEAFDNAGGAVRSVVMPVMKDAMEQQGVYMCSYFTSSGGMSVFAIAPQQQGFVFNPSVLKLDAVKAK